MNEYHRVFRLVQAGVFPEERWQEYAEEAAQWCASPGGSAWRAQNPGMPDFWAAIDELELRQVMSLKPTTAR